MIDKFRAAQEHYERGNQFDAAGDTARAIDEWQAAIRLNPNYFDAHYNLGIAYADQGDLASAIGELELAHALEPDDADAPRELAAVLVERGEAFAAAGKQADAITDLEYASQVDPKNAPAHFLLGEIYAELPDDTNAEAHYRAAIKINPFYTDAYASLADFYLKQKRIQDAMDLLKNALNTFQPGSTQNPSFLGTVPQLDAISEPSVSDLARKLAELELARGDVDQAMAALEQAAPDRQDADLWRQLGKEFAARGDHESARLAYDRAAELDEVDSMLKEEDKIASEEIKTAVADAHVQRGDELYERGNIEEAQEEWQAAIRINPDHIDAHHSLGLSFQDDEEFDLAEKEFREALRIDPEDSDAHRRLGEIFDERHDWEDAMREYRETLRIDPGDDEARGRLIWDLLEMKQVTEAQEELNQINNETAADADLWIELGEAYEERGARASAVAAYKHALRLDPNTFDGRAGLKRLAPDELKNFPSGRTTLLIIATIIAILLFIMLIALFVVSPQRF